MGAALLAGCTTSIQGCPVKYCEETAVLEVPAGAARSLVVDARAGSIDAGPGADATKVVVHALKRAPSKEDLLRIKVRAVSDDGHVRVGYEVDGDDAGISVSFTVAAPATIPASLRSGAGSIRAEGFQNGLDARSGAGSVESISVSGDQSLESGAGSLRLSAADGRVVAKTGAGSIRASGRFRGASSLETSAGSIEVCLPADARLRVDGKTSAGSVRTDFGLAVTGEFAPKEVSGTLGDGAEGSLRIESSAGSLSVLKQ